MRTLFRRIARILQPKVGSTEDRWPDLGGGLEASGRPAPRLPQRPSLSAAAAAPLPEPDTGPGIVYALGR
jgi:hypothetical protein